MTGLSQKIFDNYQVRRTKKQKLAFIELLKNYFPDLKVEEGGFLHNRNIIVGDVDSAEIIIGAHYDTCAILPFPNFITPKNIFIYILYSILICIPFFLIGGLFYYLISFIINDPDVAFLLSDIFFLIILIGGLLIGIPNKHTANDNTSGVIMLCELISRLTDEEKKNVAFVFFDNEENGLFGSSYFAKVHKKGLNDKLMINFDCISDGSNLLVVQNKNAKKEYSDLVKESFINKDNKKVYLESSKTAFYPSDQINFPKNIAIAFLNKGKLGLYMNRIHTKRDVIFDESNIEYLFMCIKNFLCIYNKNKR